MQTFNRYPTTQAARRDIYLYCHSECLGSPFEWDDATEPVGPALTRNTRLFNVTGLPTVSLPCGFTGNDLPIGLQITGRPFEEATVLGVAHSYEQAAAWSTRRPNL